jgi:hypothetical protein
MHKIKIIIFALILVGSLLVYYYWYKGNNGITDSAIIIPQEIIRETPQKETVVNNLTVQEKVKLNNLKNQQLEKLLVNRESAFDDNPLIDSELITLTYSQCIKYLNQDKQKKRVESWKANDLISKKQLKYKTAFTNYCKKTHKDHKEYLLTSPESIQLLRDTDISDDEISKIISGVYNHKDIDLNAFDLKPKMQHLKHNKPNLLLNAKKYFNRYFVHNFVYKVAEIINGGDSTYNSYVMKYALNLYACNAGADCGLHSDLVARLCLNRNLCSTDYNDILNNRMSVGMRADILLVHNYYKRILD